MRHFHFSKYPIPELLILVVFMLMINLKVGKTYPYIKADGIGYYDYLPSIFIRHDLTRKNQLLINNPEFYKTIQKKGVYVHYHGYLVDKYPVGTAVLQSPFFLITYLTTPLQGSPEDGYQKPFQHAVLYATLFYLFLGIFFLRKILEMYNVRRGIIIFIEFLAVFGTAITNYANYDASFSHIYSFFAINAFMYFCLKYFKRKDITYFLTACFFFGLILIIRNINVLILLFIPFLAGSFKQLKQVVQDILRKPKMFLFGILIIIAVISIQSWVWFEQTGSYLIYSYQGEGFNFSHPEILNILFSYKKGLFVYTPVLIFSIPEVFRLFIKHDYYRALTWSFFFLIITYIFSSWHSWDYGASYGSRVYIDYYGVFFILIAILINKVPRYLQAGIIVLSTLTVPVNLVQTYQYKNFILHWTDMTCERYWEVFLKTGKQYNGLLWKINFNPNNFTCVKKVTLGDINKNASETPLVIYKTTSRSIPDFNKVEIIQILFKNRFSGKNKSKINVRIADSASQKTEYCYDTYLIHFSQKGLNKEHRGFQCYKFNPLTDGKTKITTVSLYAPEQENTLKNFTIKFLKPVD